MYRKALSILVILVTFLLVAGPGGDAQAAKKRAAGKAPAAAREPQRSLRANYDEQAFLTARYVAGTLAGEDTDETTEKLLASQDAVGEIVGRYYNERTSTVVVERLRNYAMAVMDLVSASREGTEEDLKTLEGTFLTRSDELAELLGSINGKWRRDAVTALLHRHIQLVGDMGAALTDGDRDRAVALQREDRAVLLRFADLLAAGLAGRQQRKVPEAEPAAE